MSDEKKERSYGAMWEKQGPKGTYMTGNLEVVEGEKVAVVMFKSDKGDNPKRPDWVIFKSKPKVATAPAVEQKGQPNDPKAEQEVQTTDIPF